MNSDYECFVRTIMANPADQLARLVFADWLEDNADWLPSHGYLIAGDMRSTPALCGGGGGGDGGGDGDGDGGWIWKHKNEAIEMESGAYILAIRSSSWNPYVLVGKVEVSGFDLIVSSGRIIRRFGGNNSLAQLSENGPMSGTQLLAPSAVEIIYRPNVSRAIPISATVLKKFMAAK